MSLTLSLPPSKTKKPLFRPYLLAESLSFYLPTFLSLSTHPLSKFMASLMNGRHTGTESHSFECTVPNGATGRRETPVIVTIRHNTLTGSRHLLMNGEALLRTKAGKTLLTDCMKAEGDVVSAEVDRTDGSDGVFRISVCIKYDLVHGFAYAASVNEIKCKPAASESTVGGGQDEVTVHVSLGEWKHESISGDKVVLFSLTCVRGTDDKGPEMWYRFSKLSDFDGKLRTSYAGSAAILSSFPAFPGKCWDPRVNQLSDEFLTERKQLLENYFRRITGLPRIGVNVDFLHLMGLKINAFPVLP